MKGWVAGEDRSTITFFIKDNGKYYSVIFGKEDECWKCECGNLTCDHMKLAMELRKEGLA